MSKLEKDVVDAIRHGIIYYKDIAKKFNKTDGHILKILSILGKTQKVILLGEGYYSLPGIPGDEQSPPSPDYMNPDYIKSNETALVVLIKIRDIVNNLINKYNDGKAPFPKDEINALKTLELAYKEELKIKIELDEKQQNNQKEPKYFEDFFLLPHNRREELTPEQYENHDKYERILLDLKSDFPTDNIIIEDDEQLHFPFYTL